MDLATGVLYNVFDRRMDSRIGKEQGAVCPFTGVTKGQLAGTISLGGFRANTHNAS